MYVRRADPGSCVCRESNADAVLIFATQAGQPAVPLLSAWDLNSFSWIQRGTVQDMMAFMAKTVVERTSPTQRQSIQENNFTAHVHARPAVDGISGVLVSDSEYPVRVAYSLLNKLLEEFIIKVPKATWQSQANSIALSGNVPAKGEGLLRSSDFPQAQDYLSRYQDPRQADTILRVQQELDDTKIVLHNTIDSVLQRGEDLDKLVEKSGSLSQQSKMFYKSARKQNSCCGVM
ncbi:palmitoyltransferase [Malassezia japonica]|uniref:Palmitoyltransferase n=1 Tax=Malassezia japonica TaxID=223818 RepID=A0AAF0EXV2_9BASI|nr:palmitoyltransferase [Malassezia japonica]WFD37179.1 palmitoyltransferase [Malassezia japonica]